MTPSCPPSTRAEKMALMMRTPTTGVAPFSSACAPSKSPARTSAAACASASAATGPVALLITGRVAQTFSARPAGDLDD